MHDTLAPIDPLTLTEVNNPPYNVFRNHCTGTNNNTESVMLEAVRAAHPDLHITPVAEKHCSILGWAEAGHATATLLRNGNHFVARRRYIEPENRIEDSDDICLCPEAYDTKQGIVAGHAHSRKARSLRPSCSGSLDVLSTASSACFTSDPTLNIPFLQHPISHPAFHSISYTVHAIIVFFVIHCFVSLYCNLI